MTQNTHTSHVPRWEPKEKVKKKNEKQNNNERKQTLRKQNYSKICLFRK